MVCAACGEGTCHAVVISLLACSLHDAYALVMFPSAVQDPITNSPAVMVKRSSITRQREMEMQLEQQQAALQRQELVSSSCLLIDSVLVRFKLLSGKASWFLHLLAMSACSLPFFLFVCVLHQDWCDRFDKDTVAGVLHG